MTGNQHNPATPPGTPKPPSTPPGRRVPPKPSPPTLSDLADKHDFELLARDSLTKTRASAEAWRTGAAALITLVTAGLFIKGPEDVAKLDSDARLALTVILGLGLAVAIIGLWKMLGAAAGTPKVTTLPAMVEEFGSVKGAQIAAADKAATQLKWGQRFVVVALALLITGLGVWWWSSPAPKHQVIVTEGNKTYCGELQSGDQQTLVIKVDGEKKNREIALGDIENLSVKDECP